MLLLFVMLKVAPPKFELIIVSAPHTGGLDCIIVELGSELPYNGVEGWYYMLVGAEYPLNY